MSTNFTNKLLKKIKFNSLNANKTHWLSSWMED